MRGAKLSDKNLKRGHPNVKQGKTRILTGSLQSDAFKASYSRKTDGALPTPLPTSQRGKTRYCQWRRNRVQVGRGGGKILDSGFNYILISFDTIARIVLKISRVLHIFLKTDEIGCVHLKIVIQGMLACFAA